MKTVRLLLPCAFLWLSACASGEPAAGDDDDDDLVAIDAQPGTDTAPGVDGAAESDGAVASPCGVCPGDSTCGSANGVPVCRAPSGVPRFDHVYVVLMENTSWATLRDSDNTPYLHELFATYAISEDYHGVEHPSLANYIALASGGTADIGCDCQPTGDACNAFTCNVLLSSCGCPVAGDNLADQLDAAGLSWRAYGEDMGESCNMISSGDYAARHVPFVYFQNLQDDLPRCQAHVVDYSYAAAELAAPPAFAFVAPNLVHDMHSPFPAGPQNLANGDAWLATEIPLILASEAFSPRGLVVIAWDEDDLSGVFAPDDPIPMILLSPLAKAGGYAGATRIDHYSLLATIEDALGLPRLGAAVGATPLVDFFPSL